MFASNAADAITTELQAHGTLLDELGISREILERAEPAPTKLAYTSYLLATVRGGTYAEGVGVVLPCFQIHALLVPWGSVRNSAARLPDSRYQRWNATYAAEEYGEVVADVIAELDRVSRGISEEDSTRVRRYFRTASPTSGCSGRWVHQGILAGLARLNRRHEDCGNPRLSTI
jgi:thiaminase (transcriptional activator TenA)